MQTFSECGATVTFGKPAEHSGQSALRSAGGRATAILKSRTSSKANTAFTAVAAKCHRNRCWPRGRHVCAVSSQATVDDAGVVRSGL